MVFFKAKETKLMLNTKEEKYDTEKYKATSICLFHYSHIVWENSKR